MRRPLGIVGFSYLFSLWVAFYVPHNTKLPIAVTAAILGALTLLIWRKKAIATVLICATVAVAMLANFAVTQTQRLPAESTIGWQGALRFTVMDEPWHTVKATGFTAKVDSYQITGADDLPETFLLNVLVYGNADIQIGDVARAPVTIVETSTTGEVAFDYSIGDGIYVSATITSPEAIHIINDQDRENVAGLSHLRHSLSAGIMQQLPSRYGGLVPAMTLRDRTWLERDISQAFGKIGVSHILALSGLHFGIVVAAAIGLGTLLHMGRKYALLFGAAAAIGYAFLVGFTPSVTRTLAMVLYGMAAFYLRETVDSYTVMGMAALVLLVPNPYRIANVGLLLTFFATCGVVLLLPKLLEKYRGRKFTVLISVAQTAAVLTLTLPAVALTFGDVPPMIFIGNLLCVPLCAPIVLFGLIGAFLYPIPAVGTYLAYPFTVVAGAFAKWMVMLAEWLANIGPDKFSIQTKAGFTWLGVTLVIAALCIHLPKRRILATCAGGVLSAGLVYFIY